MEKKYVAYYRLSKEGKQSKKTKKKNNGTLGIDAQKHIVNHYYGPGIIKEFEEIKSGAEYSKRTELQNAIKYVRSNPGFVLVVAKQDRLSRNTKDVLDIYDQLGGKLICCDIPSGENAVEKFMLTIFAAISEREREIISLRTSQALQALKRKGVKLGLDNPKLQNNFTDEHRAAHALAQHDKAMKNGNTQRAVEHIKELLSKGGTWQSIADDLNKNDYHTSNKNKWTPANAWRVYQRSIKV